MRLFLTLCCCLSCLLAQAQQNKPSTKPAAKPVTTKPATKPATKAVAKPALPDQILYRVYDAGAKQPRQAVFLRGTQLTADIRSLMQTVMADPTRYGNAATPTEAREEIWMRLAGRLVRVQCADCESGIGMEMSILRRKLRDEIAQRKANDLPEVAEPEDEPEEE